MVEGIKAVPLVYKRATASTTQIRWLITFFFILDFKRQQKC